METHPIRPTLGRDVYIAPTAYVGGDVTLGDECTIMHHVTIRGDVAPIRVGRRCNVQDGTVIHTQSGVPLEIADDVAIGHRAVVHCRRIGPRSLVGIGAIVLDDCEIGAGCFLAAGTLVPPGTVIPDGTLVMGSPARVVRPVGDKERDIVDFVLQRYADLRREYAAGRYPNWNAGA